MYAFEFSQIIGVVPSVQLMADRMRLLTFFGHAEFGCLLLLLASRRIAEPRNYSLCNCRIAALQLHTEANLTTPIHELIIKAAATCYDCMQVELNSNYVTNPDGTITASEAAAIEARLNHALFSQTPLEPLVRLGVTVGEARRNEWRGIPDEPADDLWIYCRGVKAVVDRDHNVATSLCINIVWELNQPQFLPF